MEHKVIIEMSINDLKEIIKDCVYDCLNDYKEAKEQDQILTVDEACDFLHLSKPTIYSKVSRKELPVMKNGKRLYFSKHELINFLKAK